MCVSSLCTHIALYCQLAEKPAFSGFSALAPDNSAFNNIESDDGESHNGVNLCP